MQTKKIIQISNGSFSSPEEISQWKKSDFFILLKCTQWPSSLSKWSNENWSIEILRRICCRRKEYSNEKKGIFIFAVFENSSVQRKNSPKYFQLIIKWSNEHLAIEIFWNILEYSRIKLYGISLHCVRFLEYSRMWSIQISLHSVRLLEYSRMWSIRGRKIPQRR